MAYVGCSPYMTREEVTFDVVEILFSFRWSLMSDHMDTQSCCSEYHF